MASKSKTPKSTPKAAATVVRFPLVGREPPPPPSDDDPPPQAAKRRGGQRKWEPTPNERRTIERCAAIGLTQEQTASVIGKSVDAIFKHCRRELEHGAAKVHARVGAKLYAKCMKGDTVALIFWAKTRLGWRETDRRELTGANGGPIAFEKTEADAEAFTQRIAAMGQRMANKPAPDETQPALDPPRTIN